MTDNKTAPAPSTAAGNSTTAVNDQATALSGKGKAFWAGVGIGSAAIVAAVMYARRPKKK